MNKEIMSIVDKIETTMDTTPTKTTADNHLDSSTATEATKATTAKEIIRGGTAETTYPRERKSIRADQIITPKESSNIREKGAIIMRGSKEAIVESLMRALMPSKEEGSSPMKEGSKKDRLAGENRA